MDRKTVLEIVIALIIIGGGMWGVVHYFASAADLLLVDMRLEQKIVGDSIYNLYEQKTQLEIKYGNDVCSTWRGDQSNADRKRYLRVESQLKAMETRQNTIIQLQKGKQ
jgi:phage anti-repressor protein